MASQAQLNWTVLLYQLYQKQSQLEIITHLLFLWKKWVKGLYTMLILTGFSMNCCWVILRDEVPDRTTNQPFCQWQYSFSFTRNLMKHSFLESLSYCLSALPWLVWKGNSEPSMKKQPLPAVCSDRDTCNMLRWMIKACLEIMARQAGCTVIPLTPWCGFCAPPRSTQTSPVQCQGAGTLQSAPAACQPPPHAHSCLAMCPRYYFCFLIWQQEQHPPLSCRQRSDKPSHLLSVICFNSIYFQLLASPPDFCFW